MSNILLKFGYKLYVNTPFGPYYFKNEIKRANEKFENGLHSKIQIVKYGIIKVTIIPYSMTNYGFIIWNDYHPGCILIDPGCSTYFQNYLVQNNLIPKLILVTHKHHDHTYGIKELVDLYPNIEVVGSAIDEIKFATRLITNEKETFTFHFDVDETKPCIKITALLTPGHTIGHTIYSISSNEYDTLSVDGDNNYTMYFTGDTIFMGSIGRMFECKANVYFNSIQFFIQSLLDNNCPINNILIFPAHEYSIVNLKFITEKLNPTNYCAKSKLDWCINQRNLNEPTIPSTILEELSFNPFVEIVISDNIELQAALNDKFGFIGTYNRSKELLNLFSSNFDRKTLSNFKSTLNLPLKLFKEVRSMRDSVNFKE